MHRHNTLLPFLFVLISCPAALALSPLLSLSHFYHLSHSVPSLFALLFIVWFCSLHRLGARQWPCYLDYCGPLNVQQLVLVEGTQNTHNSAHPRQGREVTLHELEVQTAPFCFTLANTGLGVTNECDSELVRVQSNQQVLSLLPGFQGDS